MSKTVNVYLRIPSNSPFEQDKKNRVLQLLFFTTNRIYWQMFNHKYIDPPSGQNCKQE